MFARHDQFSKKYLKYVKPRCEFQPIRTRLIKYDRNEIKQINSYKGETKKKLKKKRI